MLPSRFHQIISHFRLWHLFTPARCFAVFHQNSRCTPFASLSCNGLLNLWPCMFWSHLCNIIWCLRHSLWHLSLATKAFRPRFTEVAASKKTFAQTAPSSLDLSSEEQTTFICPFPLSEGCIVVFCISWPSHDGTCFCLTVWPLHVFGLLKVTVFGACGHSVFNAFVQLTEGRSAWNLPKQLLAKKEVCIVVWFVVFVRIFTLLLSIGILYPML